VKVYQYDVFSKKPNKRNPAGVVLNRGELTDEEMQEIVFKVGFNETAFPVNSEVDDFEFRFFTPNHEMNKNKKRIHTNLKSIVGGCYHVRTLWIFLCGFYLSIDAVHSEYSLDKV
jgi:hypothetical protein